MAMKKISELTMMEAVSDAANVLVEENGEAKRIPANKLGGGGGLTVAVGSPDTLTWDGNTEGLVCVADMYYKISDATPTYAEMVDNAQLTGDMGEGVYTKLLTSELLDESGGFIDVFSLLLVIPETAVNMETDYGIFPEAGVYSALFGDARIYSLTIPGYTGFPVQEKLKPELMPSWNDLKDKPFGETLVEIVPPGNVQFVSNDAWGFVAIYEGVDNLSNGDIVKVVWDGTEYSNTVIADGGEAYFGNGGAMGLADTGEPYIALCAENMLMLVDFTATEATTHSVAISIKKIDTLDNQYLPFRNTTYYVASLDTDGYLYTDADCTVKATYMELRNALISGLVSCFYNANGIPLRMVPFTNGTYGSALAVIVTNPNDKKVTYYTAE